MSDVIRGRIVISGHVQGVGYRFFVLDEAERLGLRGWVRNLPDGRVEAEVEGSEIAVDELVKRLRVGPRLSHVTGVVVEPAESATAYQDFRIR
jgi:acylphosphatase